MGTTEIEETSTETTDATRGRTKELLYIRLGIISLIAITIYIVAADRPFVFRTPERSIDQKIITSSVVNIYCPSGSDENISGGSGTIISADGLVVTNSHIIPQDEVNLKTTELGCLVILPNNQSKEESEKYWAKPIVIPGLSDEYDLAYLQVYDVFTDDGGKRYGSWPRSLPSLFESAPDYEGICALSGSTQLGDPIRIFGYPQTSGGFDLTVTEGVVSSLPDNGNILTSAKVDEGNSGGLAVDVRGCMIGIPSEVMQGKYQNLGVIISTEKITEFADKVSQLTN